MATRRPPAWSSAIGDDAAREIAEAPLGQSHAPQGIIGVGIEPGRDQHELGLIGVGGGQDDLIEDSA